MFFLFYFSVFIVAYTYILYPLILRITVQKQKPRPAFETTLTVIIPAYNEIECIADKISNTLAACSNLPAQIILVTNGSTDGTENYSNPFVTNIHSKERKRLPPAN
jgi:cellulose synthase/poly-beta-1,6-N-acetylglucosamine synthase-like glycosyltransferase